MDLGLKGRSCVVTGAARHGGKPGGSDETSAPFLHGPLILTMQGFGQHEPLLRLILHAYSLSGLRYRHYVWMRAKVSPKVLPKAHRSRRQARYFSGLVIPVKPFYRALGPSSVS